MTTKRMNGQGLVEVVLILPVLLLLLAGSYVCCRAAFLLSAAESSAQTETIRTGRRLAGIEQKMSDDILPYDRSVTIRSESTDKSRLLPAPFPSRPPEGVGRLHLALHQREGRPSTRRRRRTESEN